MVNKEQVFVKNVEGLVLPSQAKEGDAGYDVIAISDPEINDTYIQYRTGLFLKIPDDCYVDIRPRSSIRKTNLILCNGPGTGDRGYLGEYIASFKYIPTVEDYKIYNNINRDDDTNEILYIDSYLEIQKNASKMYKRGDKIAQLVIRKRSEMIFTVVDDFDTFTSDRGTGGHGSTD